MYNYKYVVQRSRSAVVMELHQRHAQALAIAADARVQIAVGDRTMITVHANMLRICRSARAKIAGAAAAA